jgi:predicted dehydrogenase
MKSKPKLGFLGVGWIGRKRLESIASSGCAEITAIADPVVENCVAARNLAPEAKLLGSLDELLDVELDGIVIATPSALHAQQAFAALEAGCAVFCQKPLGRTAAEVRDIIAAARTADRLLGVDLSYRYTRALRAVRDTIASRQLGPIFAADLVFHNAYGPDKPWFYDARLSGGGCVIDLGVHLVDAALWLLNEKPIRVSGRLLRNGKPCAISAAEVEDYATAVLEFASGAVVNLACSWRLHAGKPAIIGATFYGEKGGVAFRNVAGSFTDFRAERYSGTSTEVLVEPPDDWGGGAVLAWAARLAASVRYDSTIEEHQTVAEVLDAIYGRTGLVTALTS